MPESGEPSVNWREKLNPLALKAVDRSGRLEARSAATHLRYCIRGPIFFLLLPSLS